MNFWTVSDGIGRFTILMDDVHLTSAAINDMGYEDQGDVSSNIRGYQLGNNFAESSYFSVTNTAFSGSKAANLTLSEGQSLYLRQYLAYHKIDSSKQLCLDVQWRLEDPSEVTSGYAMITVEFNNGYYLRYYFTHSMGPIINSTTTGYINVKGFNTTGQWTFMHRDLAFDYEAVFDSPPDTKIQAITLDAHAGAGDGIVLLLDDLYMYEDLGPVIGMVSHTPSSPEVNVPALISANVTDSEVDTVLVYYRVNSGSWQNDVMTNSIDSIYTTNIPGQLLDAFVEYYIFANDTYGWSATYPADMSYLNYSVADTIDPLVDITAPLDSQELNGVQIITVGASDDGSGLAYVEIYINSSLVFNGTTGPFQYSWNTSNSANGPYIIHATAYDMAGNMAYDEVTITVVNTIPTTTTTTTITTTTTTTTTTTSTNETTTTSAQTDPGMLLVIIAGGAGVVIVVVIVFVMMRKKPAV
jgi:hypothetical protein